MTDFYLLRSALDRVNRAQEEVTASPEIFRLEEYPLLKKYPQPSRAGDFEECVDGDSHALE
jgi:hypothetical protein